MVYLILNFTIQIPIVAVLIRGFMEVLLIKFDLYSIIIILIDKYLIFLTYL